MLHSCVGSWVWLRRAMEALEPEHGKSGTEYTVTGLCFHSQDPGLLGHVAYDFGEEIHSSVIKYYFALGKTSK